MNNKQYNKRNVAHVDYNNPEQGLVLLNLLNDYAMDPMGGGKPLEPNVHKTLLRKLQETRTAISLLCYDDGEAVGLINAFEGFSTFAAAPLINLHDVYIKPTHRGSGILPLMLQHLEAIAKSKGACKLTLEVLTNNKTAQAAYLKYGFHSYELLEGAGHAVFWQKELI